MNHVKTYEGKNYKDYKKYSEYLKIKYNADEVKMFRDTKSGSVYLYIEYSLSNITKKSFKDIIKLLDKFVYSVYTIGSSLRFTINNFEKNPVNGNKEFLDILDLEMSSEKYNL